MAALDFGMALARGMLPTSEKAQKDLLNLAGGRNIFKSEDWWQKQVDEQISSGYRKVKEQGREYLMPSGEYQLGRRNVSSRYIRPSWMGQPAGGIFAPAPPSSPAQAIMSGYNVQTSVSYEDPTGGKALSSRPVDVYEGRTYFTGGELSDIERSAEASAKRTKAQAEASKASQRRLRRGTGGLVGKAKLPGEAPSTGLPALGTTGLDMTAGLFGADIKL